MSSNIRIIEGYEDGEYRRIEVRGLQAVIVDFLTSEPNLTQHKHRARIVATLDLDDIKWILGRMIEHGR